MLQPHLLLLCVCFWASTPFILLAPPALVPRPAQVATLDSVVLYDTQSTVPLAVLGHLHYDSITDLAWSSDGQYLAVSSRDCYCR